MDKLADRLGEMLPSRVYDAYDRFHHYLTVRLDRVTRQKTLRRPFCVWYVFAIVAWVENLKLTCSRSFATRRPDTVKPEPRDTTAAPRVLRTSL